MLKLIAAALLAFAPVALHAQEVTPQAAPTPAPTPAPAVQPLKGETREAACKVKSIGEEYAIMRKLGLQVEMQSLVFVEGRPYDVFNGVDPQTGEKHAIWFDIKSFYGKGFGF